MTKPSLVPGSLGMRRVGRNRCRALLAMGLTVLTIVFLGSGCGEDGDGGVKPGPSPQLYTLADSATIIPEDEPAVI